MAIFTDIMTGGLYSTQTEEPFFSYTGCDVCRERTGKMLGGDVYEAIGYASLEDARAKDHYEFKVCDGCLCAYANGDEFPEGEG
jgi:hypothetical protein